MFLDEAGFSLNLYKLYGWMMGGGRLEDAVPFQRGTNLSCVGALALPGELNPSGLCALWHKVGAWTAKTFTLFVEEAVLPCVPRGSVLVLDNARIHHGQDLKKAVEEAGCSLLFLPPYSPDFNPIELFWSWLKHRVRAHGPRTNEERIHVIHHTKDQLPPQHAPNWFRKCGIPFSD